MGVLYSVLFCYMVLIFLSSFAIISLGKRNRVALMQLFSCCDVTVSVLCLLLAVPLFGLQCVIVAVPCHAHLLFDIILT